MRKRSTEILEKLILSNSKSMEVKKLITTYRISLKTLRTDVNEINDFLLEAKMSPTKLNEKEKLILLEKDIMKIQDRLNHMDTYSYKMSREERQIYIIAELLMSQDYITMQNLAKKLNVSRNTILNDFETVKDYCLAFNVNVLMKSSKGIKIECDQKDRNNLLMQIFHDLEDDYMEKSFFHQLIQRKLGMKIPLEMIKEDLREYMEQQHMLVSDRVFSYVSIYLFVILNRKINKKRRTVEKLTGDTASDNLLNWFADKYEVRINKNDVKDFGRYMKQHDFNISSEQKEINDVELYGIIVYFLQMVGEDIECSLQSDTVLIESLLEHIRTLKNWEDYDFEMPLSDELPIPKEILEKSKEKINLTKFKETEVKIVAVGKLLKSKGFDRLLRIMVRLLKEGCKVHLYILGDGPMKSEMRKYITDNYIEEYVDLLGYQLNPYKYIAKCDLFVCASYAEGFSTAATEALILGIPVCTVDVAGMKEMLGENDEYGIIVSNNENALYEKIKLLVERNDLLDHYTRQAKKRGSIFCIEETVSKVEEMLLSL